MGRKRQSRPTSRRERKTGVSPYQKYGKSEYKYSHQNAKVAQKGKR
jgi:hypothetical protein